MKQYIIVDASNSYYSSEERGRFSHGALFEKTFYFKWWAYLFKWWYKIDGKIMLHEKHWTYTMPLKVIMKFNIK